MTTDAHVLGMIGSYLFVKGGFGGPVAQLHADRLLLRLATVVAVNGWPDGSTTAEVIASDAEARVYSERLFWSIIRGPGWQRIPAGGGSEPHETGACQ